MGNCCSGQAGTGSKKQDNAVSNKEEAHRADAPNRDADKALPNTSVVEKKNLEINDIELVANQPSKEAVQERENKPVKEKERVEEIPVKEPVKETVQEPVKVIELVEVQEPVKEEQQPITTVVEEQDGQTKLLVELPIHLRKYIIGPKGQFIKDIQSQSNTTIKTDESDPKFITIDATSSSDAEKAKELLMKKLHECGWVFDADKGEYVEHGESHQSYQKSRELAEMHAQKRAECFEKSKQAFEAGDKKLAKELSEEGKKHGELMEQATKQAVKEILAHNDKGPNTIDMHGLRVAEALEALEEKINEMEKPSVLTVITGAGNHSENNNAKIKPAVVEFLRKNNYEFEEVNHGSYTVQLA